MTVVTELAPLQHNCKYADGRKRFDKPCAPRRIPIEIARACYDEWYHPNYPGQSFERINERSGFGCTELDMWDPAWRNRLP